MDRNKTLIHIVMISPDLNFQGGISSVIKEYLQAGLQKEIQLRFVTTIKQGTTLQKIIWTLKSFLKFPVAILHTPRPIVHLHVSQKGSFYRKLVFFVTAKVFGCKTIVHLHGSEFEKFMKSNFLNRFLTKFLFGRADCVLVLSSLWKNKLAEFSSNKNIQTLYNPVQLCRENKRPTDKDITEILFLGRLGERKGIYDLIGCVEQHRDYFRANRANFIVAGDGEIEKVRRIVCEKKLEDLINVPGWVSGKQKENYLKNSDIMVLPSYNEQMPMSILEGMGYGYPIVATNIAGIPDMVEEGKNGFLFTPGDAQAMGEALKSLCVDKNLRFEMGRRSQQIVQEKFESTVILNQLLKIYEEIA